MTNELRNHYLATGIYTYSGLYKDYFTSLPDNVPALGRLICSQVIHRVTLKQGNTNANKNLLYGDMNLFPWDRMRCEDDIFLTAVAMTAELFRLNGKGFVMDRKVEHKLVVTCRYVSVLMSAILKAKGVPCRCRSGFAPYIDENESGDHWINQYWSDNKNSWITFDADGFFTEDDLGFDQFDIPQNRFDWAADTWLSIRQGRIDGNRFVYAGGMRSLKAVMRAVFYDFHSLMNNEISYKFQPAFIDEKFDRLSEQDFCEIDALCCLLQNPDENFKELHNLWNDCKKFRILNSPLVGDRDNNI